VNLSHDYLSNPIRGQLSGDVLLPFPLTLVPPRYLSQKDGKRLKEKGENEGNSSSVSVKAVR